VLALAALAERRDDLAALIGNLNETTRAIGNQKAALAEAIGGLPDFMRQSNTTFVNLRATLDDLDRLVPACAAAHAEEIGIDPLRRDPDGFRWRTRAQIEEGRSWLWAEDGVILFKAEASAWTPGAVQLQQVWTDPEARGSGNARRGLCDLIRLLLERVPRVCLFVRADNAAAIALYDTVGMEHVLDYRSVLL